MRTDCIPPRRKAVKPNYAFDSRRMAGRVIQYRAWHIVTACVLRNSAPSENADARFFRALPYGVIFQTTPCPNAPPEEAVP